MTATIIAFKRSRRPDADPPRRCSRITRKLWDDLLGMTSRQSEMASHLSIRSRERHRQTWSALAQYIEALRDFEPVLDAYREELLKNMDAYCPRSAKRIREGKPPRRSRKRAKPA
jgi:hypothetical protein